MDEEPTIGGRVYQALKARVTSGEFRPGQRLDPPRLAKETEASLTTIYNALRHLAVEHLVASPRNEGFYLPMVTEIQLRGSYEWTCALACLGVTNAAPALANQSKPEPLSFPANADITARTEMFFAALAALPEIDEFREAMGAASDRLRAIRRLEPYLFPDAEDELGHLIEAVPEPDRLTTLISGYRDRRIAAVPNLTRLRIRG